MCNDKLFREIIIDVLELICMYMFVWSECKINWEKEIIILFNDILNFKVVEKMFGGWFMD